MKALNLKSIILAVGFIGLAGFSCYWTAESLFIWQPSITIAGAWLIAVVFYIIASLSFSYFVKGFDKYGDFGAHPTNPVEGCADANPKTELPNDT